MIQLIILIIVLTLTLMFTARSKPFQLKVRSNSDAIINGLYGQNGFELRYIQLPCVN